MTATVTSLLSGTTSPGVFVWRGAVDDDLATRARDAGWDVLALDTGDASSPSEVYDRMQLAWQLPAWFGRNLDALWDVLADRSARRTLIEWSAPDALAARDPDFVVMLLGVLRDAATQADQLAVVLRPGPGGIADPLFSELDGLL